MLASLPSEATSTIVTGTISCAAGVACAALESDQLSAAYRSEERHSIAIMITNRIRRMSTLTSGAWITRVLSTISSYRYHHMRICQPATLRQ